MNLTLPTEGASSGTWDELLNDALDLVDAHDHSTGKGTKVTQAGINLTGDLEHNGGSATELRSIDFSLVASASMAGRVRGLWWNSADSELYIRTNAGADIKLTSGGAINISIAGGIGGDYGSVSALLDYDDATDTYRLRQQVGAAVRQYGKAATAGLDLYEYKAHPTAGVPTTRVRLSSPAALGASYELVFAGALPGSTQLMQVSAAGVLTYSNAIANAVTLSALLTANAGITLGVNQHATVSGTGSYKHGDETICFVPEPTNATNSIAWNGLPTVGYLFSTALGRLMVSLPPIPVGRRIKSLTYRRYGDAAVDITDSFLYVKKSDASVTAMNAVSVTVTNVAAAWADTTITADGGGYTLAAGEAPFVNIEFNAANLRIGNMTVVYNYP